jgi:hypothetical protein
MILTKFLTLRSRRKRRLRRAHRADPAAHNFFRGKSPAVPPSLDGLAVFAKIGGVNVTDGPIFGESRS